MTELSGTLEGVGLAAILRFLAGLKKTGCLRVSHGDWRGEVLFEDGRVIGARLGSRTGRSALDALVQALPAGAFEFDASWRPETGSTIQLGRDGSEGHLDELEWRGAHARPRLPSVDAVPTLVAEQESASGDEPLSASGDEPLSLDRGTLQTLLAVDGRRTVRAIVAQRGSFDALWQLGSLIEIGLVRIASAGADVPTRSSTGADVPTRSRSRTEAMARSAAAAAVVPAWSSTAQVPSTSGPAEAPAGASPAEAPAGASPAADARAGSTAATDAARRPSAAEVPAGATAAPRVPSRSAAATDAPERSGAAPGTAGAAEVAAGRAPEVGAPWGRDEGATVVRPFAPAGAEPARSSPGACPKLGFEDDPSTSFGRPTRLHRCFAAGRPLPLSMDQQRELCLNEQFATCPRLAAPGVAPAPAPAADAARDAPDDPRIVRWPDAGRARMASRAASASAERPAAGEASAGAPEAPRGRPPRAAFREGAGREGAGREGAGREGAVARPMPLRSRLERPPASPSTTAVLEPWAVPAAASAGDAAHAEPDPARAPANEPPRPGLLRGVPLPVIGGAAVLMVVLAAVGYLLAPRLAPLLADETLDPARLPNTSAVAAGTPVAQVAAPRLTADSGAAAQSAPAVSATRVPGTRVTAVGQPTPPPPPTVAQAPSATLLDERFDERFTAGAGGWPNDAQSTAWLGDGVYHVATRRAGQFVAISAPLAHVPSNVIVSATLRKVGGPPGGGYGVVVRDQGPEAQDGVGQAGRYYVLEVGDKGEVGIWRRETDHWVDLLPWQRSDAVKPGIASNDVAVRAIGNTLSLIVNGVQVATRTDATYTSGRIGLFVGGDGNQVAVDRFVAQTP